MLHIYIYIYNISRLRVKHLLLETYRLAVAVHSYNFRITVGNDKIKLNSGEGTSVKLHCKNTVLSTHTHIHTHKENIEFLLLNTGYTLSLCYGCNIYISCKRCSFSSKIGFISNNAAANQHSLTHRKQYIRRLIALQVEEKIYCLQHENEGN